MPVFVDDFCLVSGDDLSAGPGSRFPRTVGDDHLQSLRRSQRIQNLDAKALPETLKQGSRKGLARRYGVTHTGKVKLSSIGALVCQQGRVVCRYRIENGRPVALDIRIDRGRSRTPWGQNRGGASGQREIAGVP